MQYHVVIVEDNPLTIRSLMETIDWAALDCEIVGTARDGEAGKRLLFHDPEHARVSAVENLIKKS